MDLDDLRGDATHKIYGILFLIYIKGRVYSSVGRKYNTGAILPSDGRIVPLLSRAIRPS